MPHLVTPNAALHDAFLAAHREWGAGLHEDGFGIRPEDDVDTPTGFAQWVARLDERPATSWWIVDGERAVAEDAGTSPRILGAIALRPTEFTDTLTTGHIGYGVTPSARGRGIATWALTAVLDEAARRGLPSCVLVCLDDNAASIRTIERCGGRLQSTVTDDEGVTRRIYRIGVSDAPEGPGLRPDSRGCDPDSPGAVTEPA